MNINKKLGFTLVELLIVISIMGILTVVGFASFRNIQIKSRDVRRKNDLNSISKALNMYYNEVGSFPTDSPDINYMITHVGIGFSADVNGVVSTYMVEVPTETTSNVENYFYISNTGKSFKLFANLENSEDSSCLESDTINEYTIGENGCIYGVSSSNIKIEDDLL